MDNDKTARDDRRMAAREHTQKGAGKGLGIEEARAQAEEFLARAGDFEVEQADSDRKAKALEERVLELRWRSNRCQLLASEARKDAERLMGAVRTLTGFKSDLEATKESLRQKDKEQEE